VVEYRIGLKQELCQGFDVFPEKYFLLSNIFHMVNGWKDERFTFFRFWGSAYVSFLCSLLFSFAVSALRGKRNSFFYSFKFYPSLGFFFFFCKKRSKSFQKGIIIFQLCPLDLLFIKLAFYILSENSFPVLILLIFGTPFSFGIRLDSFWSLSVYSEEEGEEVGRSFSFA
jgi:hypothetical protein